MGSEWERRICMELALVKGKIDRGEGAGGGTHDGGDVERALARDEGEVEAERPEELASVVAQFMARGRRRRGKVIIVIFRLIEEV